MLELVGGSATRSVDKISSKSAKEGPLGLDFANLLEQAQLDQDTAPLAPSQKNSLHPAEKKVEREDTAVEMDQEAEEANPTMEKKSDRREENTELAAGAAETRGDRTEEVDEEEQMSAVILDADTADWADLHASKGGESEDDAALDAALFDAVEPEIAAAPVPVQNAASGNPLELLNVTEMMDPDIVLEKGVEQISTRIAQAAGGQAAVMEEMAETVLPQVIRSVASLVRAGGAEMRLQLQPADLGEIELRVRTAEAAVRGEVVVSNPEVKQLLEQNMSRLRDALAEQGLDLEGFSVDVGGQSAFTEGQGDSSQRSAPNRRALDGEPAEAVPTPVAARRPDSGDVDFTA